jgi:hypothetical protein
MSWRDFDLGGLLAFLLALAFTLMTAEILIVEGQFHAVWILALTAGMLLAWAALWAWRRQRWPTAAGLFFLTLGWPGGFAIVLTVPFSFGLCIVSLIRAGSERRVRRKLARRAAPGR